MATMAKTFLRTILKVMNSLMGMVGIAMILYGFWMVRVWQKDMEDSSSDDYISSSPWFICTFIGIGIFLCFMTCLGHTSAESANGFCLSFYIVTIVVFLLLETAVAADILLNSDWEKDLPDDPTGRFHDFKEFVESNRDVFKWMGMLILLAQGCCILLAMALKALGRNVVSNYGNDVEYSPARLPLMNQDLQPHSYVVGDPLFTSIADPWNKNSIKYSEK